MPSGLERFHHSGQSHFVTFTCYHRLPHLEDDEACQSFVAALEQARNRYRFRVYGFVLMPEHVHLLVSEPERGTVASVIQAVKLSSSLRTAAAREKQTLWQKRYYDRNVRDYEEFVEKLQYLHRNPVKRGWRSGQKTGSGAGSATMLCARTAAWRSSRNGLRIEEALGCELGAIPHSRGKTNPEM